MLGGLLEGVLITLLCSAVDLAICRVVTVQLPTCVCLLQGRLVEMALTTLQNLQEEGPTQEEVETLRRIETFEWVSFYV